MSIDTVVVSKDKLDMLMPLIVEQQYDCGKEVDLATTRTFFEGIVDNEASFQIMAAEDDVAVGFVMVDPIPNLQFADKVAYVHDVFVTESLRGVRGIGAILMVAGFAEAMRRGYEFAEGETDPDNRPARKLYERMAKKLGIGCKEVASVRYLVDLRPGIERARREPEYLDLLATPQLLSRQSARPGADS
ncbi:GNAT family N-acetyltransferase [Streptantibioticus ferralitis]|uniref:GNAT family N-acetyltransferase n=1 Tax=Streptantibioticus ferralitis TaxID=236510 RepID=A0ABT5YTT4_9ACTN|nr:GNAT family N-acetyltransferase [Streptantibioticus ferralitis]MDF2254868.1 GNAT family N-acetyltransferase [Streptantibioticus ferralitis]